MSSPYSFDFGSETGLDAVASTASVESRLKILQEQILLLQSQKEVDKLGLAKLNVDAAAVLLKLNQKKIAWQRAKPQFDIFMKEKCWRNAILVCEILFLSDQEGSIVALGNGVWLAVTFPIDPHITARMLQHVVEATPDDADGAAVAAATAVYIAQLRADLTADSDLYLYTTQMLATVARVHSDVIEQAEFEQWMAKLELYDPNKFLVRLRNVIDVLVQDEWWFNRDQIQSQLPPMNS